MALSANTIFGVMALPPAAGTNNLAALRTVQIREVSQRSFANGQITVNGSVPTFPSRGGRNFPCG